MSLTYPNVMFTSNALSLALPPGVRQKAIKINSKHKHPDILVINHVGIYSGLAIELKVTSSELYDLSGNLRKTTHLKEQKETLKLYENNGYRAIFSFGFENTIKQIRCYLENE
jgi:hypothetical protein